MRAFRVVIILLSLCSINAMNILEKQIISSLERFSSIEKFVDSVISKNFKKQSLIVVFMSKRDVYEPFSDEDEIYTNALRWPTNKPVYVIRGNEYITMARDKKVDQKIFTQSDVLFINDKIDAKAYIPPILKSNKQVLFFIGPDIKFRFHCHSSLIKATILNSEDLDVQIYKPSKDCGNCEKVADFIQFSSGKRQINEIITKSNRRTDICNVDLIFITYTFVNKELKDQLEFLASHFTIKLISELMPKLRFRIKFGVTNLLSNITYYDNVKNEILDNTQIEWNQNVLTYHDYHSMGSTDANFVAKSTSLINFITTDEIVWFIVNHPDIVRSWINLWIIVSVTLVAIGSIMGTSLVLDWKFPQFSSKFRSIECIIYKCIGIFFNVSQNPQPKRDITRLAFISFTLLSSVLTMCYYYKILEIITTPEYNTINNQQELLASGITLYVFSEDYADIAFNNITSDERYYINYAPFYTRHNTGETKNNSFGEFIIDVIKKGQPIGILMDLNLSKRIMSHFPSLRYYYLPSVTQYPLNLFMERRTEFSFQFNKYFSRLFEAGIVEKAVKNFSGEYAVRSFSTNPDYININFLYPVFVLVAILYMFAILLFVIEFAFVKFVMKKLK